MTTTEHGSAFFMLFAFVIQRADAIRLARTMEADHGQAFAAHGLRRCSIGIRSLRHPEFHCPKWMTEPDGKKAPLPELAGLPRAKRQELALGLLDDICSAPWWPTAVVWDKSQPFTAGLEDHEYRERIWDPLITDAVASLSGSPDATPRLFVGGDPLIGQGAALAAAVKAGTLEDYRYARSDAKILLQAADMGVHLVKESLAKTGSSRILPPRYDIAALNGLRPNFASTIRFVNP